MQKLLKIYEMPLISIIFVSKIKIYNHKRSMRKVIIGIGGQLLDIIFKEGQIVSAVPGGSALMPISLGRCGKWGPTFISGASVMNCIMIA